MPKPFSAFVEIEQAFVGEVLTRIRGMRGVVGVGFDDGKKPQANGHDDGAPVVHRGERGPYKKYDTPGDEAVMKILFTSKTPLTSTHLKDHFIALGRSPASINSLIHIMLKRGDLEKRDDGYVLSRKLKDRLRHQLAARKKRR